MSRVAKKPITMPKGVELKDADGMLSRQGPEGHPDHGQAGRRRASSNENGMVQLGRRQCRTT